MNSYYKNKFLIEMEAKNKAYHFILSNGLLNEFREFCKENEDVDSFEESRNVLVSTILNSQNYVKSTRLSKA